MKDMLGNTIEINSIVLYPDGSPRYGGLYFMLGVVLSMTDKRVKIITTRLDADKPISYKNKTPHKLLVINDTNIEISSKLKELKNENSKTIA